MLSRDAESGELSYQPVVRTFVRHDVPTLELTVVGDGLTERIETTGEHPFWVRGRGWVEARELQPGDELFTSSGGWLRVAGGTWTGHTATVYNFEVAGTHTYFVGDSAVWVHNICAADRAALEGVARSFGNKQCKQCYDELVKTANDLGLAGKKLEVYTGHSTGRSANIYSDTAKDNIADNRRHYAVEIDGLVFDNIHPRGIPRADWEKDFVVVNAAAPWGVTFNSDAVTITETCIKQ